MKDGFGERPPVRRDDGRAAHLRFDGDIAERFDVKRWHQNSPRVGEQFRLGRSEAAVVDDFQFKAGLFGGLLRDGKALAGGVPSDEKQIVLRIAGRPVLRIVEKMRDDGVEETVFGGEIRLLRIDGMLVGV